jgi:hypothetical protein
MITKDEWHRTAEFAAAAKWGEEHKSWFVFRRFGLPVLAVVVPVGLVGFLLWKAWQALSGSFSGHGAATMPALFWIVGGALLVATIIAFRPRTAFVTFGALMVKVGVLLALWLGYVAYGIGMIVS